MKYDNIIFGTFVERPNRFVAKVLINGVEHTVHVKNTGRCKELLTRGCRVVLAESVNSTSRKTKYDLVAVYKNGETLFNIDSQAPNRAVREWIEESRLFDTVKPEHTFGSSRIDFFMQREDKKYLMEVKGCTLEINGVGYFPDAPTERGVKHLKELVAAKQAGYDSFAAFVIQAEGITEVRPNGITHPAFAHAWDEALSAGVKILFLPCRVTPDSIRITENPNILL